MDWHRIDRMPSMAAVMTPFPYSVNVHDPIERAWDLMHQHKIRHVPVRDQHALVGVVSERDLIAFGDHVRADASGEPIKVGYLCRPDPYVVETTARLDDVVLTMATRHIGSAIVVKDGRLAGIFTSSDACRFLAELLKSRFPGPGADLVA